MNQMQLINMMMQNPKFKNNPILGNAIKLMQNGDCQNLQKLAENLAKSKGVNINDLISQIKSNLQI